MAAVLLAFAALAAWQWDEYSRECALARETVVNSADSVMNALVGGIRSHRRLGQFFPNKSRESWMDLSSRKMCGRSPWFLRKVRPSCRPASANCSTWYHRLLRANTGMKAVFGLWTNFACLRKQRAPKEDAAEV